MGKTPLQIKSEIEDLKIFLITKSGFLKSRKWTPSLYVSIETTNDYFLTKKTSSFKFNEALFNLDNFEKYFWIKSNSCIWSS